MRSGNGLNLLTTIFNDFLARFFETNALVDVYFSHLDIIYDVPVVDITVNVCFWRIKYLTFLDLHLDVAYFLLLRSQL
jgi:hypothetical protein